MMIINNAYRLVYVQAHQVLQQASTYIRLHIHSHILVIIQSFIYIRYFIIVTHLPSPKYLPSALYYHRHMHFTINKERCASPVLLRVVVHINERFRSTYYHSDSL